MYSKIVVYLVIYLQVVICEKSKSNSDEVFVATHEWQVIKEGQSIPKGLHVRINFETGIKEAKLLDPDEKEQQTTSSAQHEVSSSSALLAVQPTEDETENSNLYSPEELKNKLQNIKSDENLPTIDVDDVERVKHKFRDYKQLQEELGDLNMTVKTDAEILQDFFQKFKDINSKLGIDSASRNMLFIEILGELEYLVHQIDNANEFIKMNGISEIIYPSLNNSAPNIRSEALIILGSCVQNNAQAQIRALESGAIDKVLRLLAVESDKNVKLRTVFALSSLLRRFPLAQKQFLSNGGLDVFSKIFSKPEDLKEQLKIITLLYDLLVEENHAIEIEKTDTEKVKQYTDVALKNTLIENGWCATFNDVLVRIGNIYPTDHDAVEKCLVTIKILVPHCLSTFHNTNLLLTLNKLYDLYDGFTKSEIPDEMDDNFNDLYFLIESVRTIVTTYKNEL